MNIRGMQTGPLQVNTYLISDENTGKGAIIDPGGFDQRFVNLINEDALEIEYILLTHGHADHIGGIPKFRELYPEAKLVSSEIEKELLKDADYNLANMTFGRPLIMEPDFTVTEGDTIDLGDTQLSFVMTPGHTKGSMCIVGDGVIFSGDTLFRDSIGRSDFPGGSYDEILSSIKDKLFTYPDQTVILPGHMSQTTIGHEKLSNPFVQD